MPLADTGDYDGLTQILSADGREVVQWWNATDEEEKVAERIVRTINDGNRLQDELREARLETARTATEALRTIGSAVETPEAHTDWARTVDVAHRAVGKLPTETSDDAATATTCAILRTFERALVKIDTYTPSSTVQPVQIARDALREAYGPNYRSAARLPEKAPAPRDERYEKLFARLTHAESLILRMAGEGSLRSKLYVAQYDLTGERSAEKTGGES